MQYWPRVGYESDIFVLTVASVFILTPIFCALADRNAQTDGKTVVHCRQQESEERVDMFFVITHFDHLKLIYFDYRQAVVRECRDLKSLLVPIILIKILRQITSRTFVFELIIAEIL